MGNQIPLFFSFNTQPPEGGWLLLAGSLELGEVSTHSRPKAAGFCWQVRWSWAKFQHTAARRRLESGKTVIKTLHSFNTQPPEGGWVESLPSATQVESFNTQPPEGGWFFLRASLRVLQVSTHSRPKAAGSSPRPSSAFFSVSTHSRPKAAGTGLDAPKKWAWFQHTAARRRLDTDHTV